MTNEILAEKAIHADIELTLKRIEREHGIRITYISADWRDDSGPGGYKANIDSIQLITQSGAIK